MDLFVINRYKDEESTADSVDQEALNLQKLKQRIEQRKKAIQSRKAPEPTEIILQDKESTVLPSPEVVQSQTSLRDQVTVQPELPKKTSAVVTEKQTEFKVFGINEFEKKPRVKRVLPYWLSHPLSVSTSLQDLPTPVSEEAWLHPTLRQTLIAEGISHLFPVQKAVAPYVIKAHVGSSPFWPNDVCVSAPTGSGKTLAFVLPIVQVLMERPGTGVGALVVVPVQELAQQVARVFRKYCSHSSLKVALLSAATPLAQEQKQIIRYTDCNGWVSEVDIIVCTAGRLVEHLQGTPGFSLRGLRFLVIDEADRIMDHIQNDWLSHLDRHIKLDTELMTAKVPMLSWNNITSQPKLPHKLLFSATLSQDPEKLEQWGLFQPKLFSASDQQIDDDDDDAIRKYTTPEELTEKSIICDAEQKPLILYYLLRDQKWDRVLCFTNASQAAHRLSALLNNMGEGALKVAEISAALDRQSREAVLKKFHAGEINVLISTDALARGIDVPLCDYVVSYDLPKNIKTYIHRVGRTGRAGRRGVAVTMMLHAQETLFKNLLHSGGKSTLSRVEIPEHIYDEYADKYERAIQETKSQIHTEINTRVKKSIALKRGYKGNMDNRNRSGGEKRPFKKMRKFNDKQ